MSLYNATVRQLAWLRDNGYLTDQNEALGELALNLARTLENGAGLAQAAVAAQLRQTFQEIAKAKGEDDDGFGEWASGLSVAGLSGLGNPKNT